MAEGYKEDVVPGLHTGDNPVDGNKHEVGFDLSSDPGPTNKFPVTPTFGENDFPRQTGSDSMGGGDDLVILGG